MRRTFTLQVHDLPRPHAHICHECCKQWECRLDCTISWIAEDFEHLGSDVLDRGEDTLCPQCLNAPIPPRCSACGGPTDVHLEKHVVIHDPDTRTETFYSANCQWGPCSNLMALIDRNDRKGLVLVSSLRPELV